MLEWKHGRASCIPKQTKALWKQVQAWSRGSSSSQVTSFSLYLWLHFLLVLLYLEYCPWSYYRNRFTGITCQVLTQWTMSNTACNTGRLVGAWPVMPNHRDTINCSGGKQGVRKSYHELNLGPSFSISQLLPSCSSKTAHSSLLLFSLPLIYPLAGSTMFLAGGCAEFSI